MALISERNGLQLEQRNLPMSASISHNSADILTFTISFSFFFFFFLLITRRFLSVAKLHAVGVYGDWREKNSLVTAFNKGRA